MTFLQLISQRCVPQFFSPRRKTTCAATLWLAELQLKKQFCYINMHYRNINLRKLIKPQNKFLNLFSGNRISQIRIKGNILYFLMNLWEIKTEPAGRQYIKMMDFNLSNTSNSSGQFLFICITELCFITLWKKKVHWSIPKTFISN
jgi:hypothetical protein